jgi:hypothetical protein
MAAAGQSGDAAFANQASPQSIDNLTQLTPPQLALAPRDRRWRRGARRVRRGLKASVRPFALIALFSLGVALGLSAWLRSERPPAAAPPAAMEAGTTADIPTQVQSLVAALNSDNQTQVQTVVPTQPYRLLAGELAQRGVTRIRGARALSTYVNGSDSATEILIGGYDASGSGVLLNLVVHLHAGVITEFR